MADTRTLRRPAVAGHARAVVKYVGHFELHVYVTSGLPDPCPSRAKRKVDRLGLFYNLFLREPRQITRDCDEVHGDSRLRGTVGSGEEAPQTDCRFLCPKLCETALDDSYRGGIPRGSRTFGPRLNDRSVPALSALRRGSTNVYDVTNCSQSTNRDARRATSRRSNQGRRCIRMSKGSARGAVDRSIQT